MMLSRGSCCKGVNMHVLVTGVTGFIGNYVVKELLDRGLKVTATARDAEHAKKYDWHGSVEFIEYDLNEKREDVYELFGRPDLLIHLAWEGLPNYKDLIHFEKNLFNNHMFIRSMLDKGLKDLSVTGTCFEYGLQEGCLSEYLETRPETLYALSKDTLRKVIEERKRIYDFRFRWIRLFYMYGEGQSPNSILSQLDRAIDNNEKAFNMSGGEQLRDYLPVEKVAEYIVSISTQDKVEGIVNCCSGKPISIKRLVSDHIKQRGAQIELNLGYYPYNDTEPMEFWGDDRKLRSIIGKTRGDEQKA